MIFVKKTKLPPLNNYVKLLKKIWRNKILTNEGPFEKKLTRYFQKLNKTKNIQLVANGTLALQLAIRSLNLKGQIITTPYSYVATCNAIKWENCEPVFVDINKNDFGINADLIEKKITKKTSAILATHVYGMPCDVYKIIKIAKKYNLKVIFDASHAYGVLIKKKPLIKFGDASTLSLHATKVFNTAEGGLIYTRKKNICINANLAKKFGHIGEENYYQLGINAKISEFHCALGLANLKLQKKELKLRKKIFMKYYMNFYKIKNIKLIELKKNVKYNYSYFPIIFENYKKMMRIKNELKKNRIIARRYFYPSLNMLSYISKYKKCEVSESISSRVLALPLYSELKFNEQKKIINIIKKFY